MMHSHTNCICLTFSTVRFKCFFKSPCREYAWWWSLWWWYRWWWNCHEKEVSTRAREGFKTFFFKSSFVKVPSSWYLPERLAPWDGSGLYRERDWCNLCNARCIIFAPHPANCDKSVWTLVKNASTPEAKIDARTKWTKNGILFLFLHQSEVNGEDLSPVHIGQESETLKYHEVSVRFWDLVVFFLQFILCNLLGFIWLVCDSLAVCCFGSQRIDTKKSVPDA